MSQSTDGEICFGYKFEEEYGFPWVENEDDPEDWWAEDVHNYKPPFKMFTEDGQWVGGKEWPVEKRKDYWLHKENFKENMPKLPFKLVNYCSAECPMYMLATPSSILTARRGYPLEFDPRNLKVIESEIKELNAFIAKYDLKPENEAPSWFLSSYWG